MSGKKAQPAKPVKKAQPAKPASKPKGKLAESEPKESEESAQTKPTLTCRFFKTSAGNEPVRDWLKDLPAPVRKEIGSDIQSTQWRWPVGKPLVDGFGEGLFEVRTNYDKNFYRVLFCLEGSEMVLLHGIMKKTNATPPQDVELARKRMREEEEES